MDWSVLKANSFLGFCSIRKGVFIIALSQLGIGVCMFFIISYLRPSLLTLAYAILIFFTIACSLGIISAAKKSVFITFIYLCVSIVGIALQAMIVAELSEVVHFLPKPESDANPLTIAPTQDSSSSIVGKQSNNSASADKNPEKKNQVDNEIIHAIRLSKHKISPEKMNLKRKTPLIAHSKFNKPFHSTNLLANSFYDSLPFVPHLGETEGESEEVSKEELPPEIKNLNNEEKSEVIAIYKIQKRPIKLLSSALFSVILLFSIYNIWVIFTFFVNKCTNLDELKQQPEQFTPLVEGVL